MSKKFHIGANGPAPCKATIRCRLGGEHFDTMEKASAAYHVQMGNNFSGIMTKKTSRRFKRFGAAALTMVAAMSFAACDTVAKVQVPDSIPSVARTDTGQKSEPEQKVEQTESPKSRLDQARQKLEQSRNKVEESAGKVDLDSAKNKVDETRKKVEQELDKVGTISPTTQKADNTVTAEKVATAKEQLSQLETRTKMEEGRYNRKKQFGDWKDTDGNDCDTRNDILQRDLSNVTLKSGSHCVVTSGTLVNDPYTGKTIQFKKARKGEKSASVQVDHIVSLHDAWNSGMGSPSRAATGSRERRAIANDPDNLVAVDSDTNMHSKGDKTAAKWTPHTDYQCTYVIKQVNIKTKYKLSVTKVEKANMESILNNSCNVS